MSEIKLVDSVVQEALSILKQSSLDFDGDFTLEKGLNQLNLMDKMEEINRHLKELVTSYRDLLLQNENATREAVETLKEADRVVANGYRIMK